MKVAGKLIKDRRQIYGMSQRDLASGICAQATVSLIENRNSCQSLEILHPICYRLNLHLRSVVRIIKNSHDIESEILNGNYSQAYHTFRKTPLSRFHRPRYMNRYFCYRGFFALNDKNYFNALYFFNKAINFGYGNNFHQAWANFGLGQIYFEQHDSVKALEFLSSANRILSNYINQQTSERLNLFVALRLKIGSILTSLGAFKESNQTYYQTILVLVRIHSMYRIAEVYMQLNQNYLKMNHRRHARLALKRARMFHHLYQKPKLLYKSE